MTGYLLDDPRFMKEDKDRKDKVDKVFSDVQKLSQGPDLSERYSYTYTANASYGEARTES